MKAKIDLEKFICSLMKRFYKIHNIDPLTTKCWLDKVLEDQGLEYRDGEIVEIPQDSEDERIKKEILDLVSISDNGNQFEEIKDWLEYKPQGKTALETAKEEKVDNANKVEPKFKIGDWVMYCGKPYQITGLQYDTFTLTSCDGSYFFNNVKSTNEPSFHLWTIQDAKDGDTLCYKDEISLYKHDIKNCTKQETTFGGFVYHCCYDGKRFITDSLYSLTEQDKTDIHPATKEQRDILFAKMKEKGYEWDAEKKELKEILEKQGEQKLIVDGIPTATNYDKWFQNCNVLKFHQGDWVVYNNDICQIVKREEGCNKLVTVFGIEKELVNERNLSTAHLWTIQDAKPGDVLACEDGWTCIFKSLNDGDTFGSYCFMDSTKWFCEKRSECHTLNTEYMKAYHGEIKPATKEQRDTLFAKMKETGYEWDADKKELKKIEQKLVSSEKIGKNDTLLDLLQKMPSCITVDGIDYHFVMKKTIAFMAFYEGEGEGSGKVIFWMAGDPIELLTAMLEKLKEKGLLE